MTENNTEMEESAGGFRQWVEDNLRLIVSIIIVLAIAGGIYSYSQRSKEAEIALTEQANQEDMLIGDEENEQAQEVTPENIQPTEEKPSIENAATDETKQIAMKEEDQKEQELEKAREQQAKEKAEQERKAKEEQKAEEARKQELSEMQKNQENQAPQEKTETPEPQQPKTATNTETATSFVEVATRGEGLTHMARRTLVGYLEKNPDSQLTKEQKIYIEDYMRRHVNYKGGVHVGSQVEFSKTLVQDAISKSKQLNSEQMKNLERFSQLVPSLS